MAVSPLEAFRLAGQDVLYSNASSLESAKAAADAADIAIIFASAHSGEGSDRKNLLLQPIGAKDTGNFGNHGSGAWELSMEAVIEAVSAHHKTSEAGSGSQTPVVVVTAVPVRQCEQESSKSDLPQISGLL